MKRYILILLCLISTIGKSQVINLKIDTITNTTNIVQLKQGIKYINLSANAGQSQLLCASDDTITLIGTAVGADSVKWYVKYSDGSASTGAYSDRFNDTTYYYPSSADLDSMILSVYMVAYSDLVFSQVDSVVSGTKTITLLPIPIPYAGADSTIAVDTMTIADATLQNADTTSFYWTTENSGTFNDTTIINPRYTFAAEGTDTLVLHAEGCVCDYETDTVLLTYSVSGDTCLAQIITDGDFPDNTNWTEGTDWTITGGAATYAGTTNGNLDQASGDMATPLALSTTYEYSFDLTLGTGTDVSFSFRDDADNELEGFSNVTSSGTLTGTFSSVGFGAASKGFRIYGSAVSDGSFSIDNLCIEPQ